VKVGVLLKGIGNPQEHSLIEMFSHDLKANGKILTAEPTGNGNARNPCDIDWNGEDIG
jgi:hypothetical protein